MSDPNNDFQTPPPPPASETPARQPAHMRPVAIILLVVGIGTILGGIANLIPGGVLTGAALAVLGILLFGLSFVRLPQVAPDAPAPLSSFERIAGIFYEPSRVFLNLRAYPRWLVALLIIALVNVIYVTVFTQRLTSERIVNYVTEKMAETPFISPEAVERAKEQQLEEAKSPVRRAGTALKSIVGAFFVMSFVAALYLLGVLAFGGRINFWQALAVAVHAALPVVVIQKALSLVILFVKSPEDIHPLLGQESLVQDNLGVLFSPKDHPVLFVAATAIGILSFYKLWLTATALRNGCQKVSSSVGWGVAVSVWVLALLLSMAIAAIFPSFIS